MKSKMLVIISSILIFFSVLFWGKDIYLKNIITKKLSNSLKQEVNIKKVSLNIFSNSFELKDLLLTKDNISIEKVHGNMNFKNFFKNKNNFTIDNLDLTGINFYNNLSFNNKESLNSKNSSNENTVEFLKEIDRKIEFDKNISKFFSSSFNKDNFSKSLSNNLTDFLIKNSDYIDTIIQKEINIQFKDQIEYFTKRSKDILIDLQKYNNTEITNNIFIKNIIISGQIMDINFSGSFKDFNTTLSKNNSIPLNILLSHENSTGKIYGDINTKNLAANLYISLSNFNIESFPKIKSYISTGTLTTEQSIAILGDLLKIDGTTKIDRFSLNKEFILESEKLDTTKKEILKELINLTETNYHSLTISNNFSNNMGIVIIKTSIPIEIKRVLTNNRQTFVEFLDKQLKLKYEENIKEKKNKIKNFFKNIF